MNNNKPQEISKFGSPTSPLTFLNTNSRSEIRSLSVNCDNAIIVAVDEQSTVHIWWTNDNCFGNDNDDDENNDNKRSEEVEEEEEEEEVFPPNFSFTNYHSQYLPSINRVNSLKCSKVSPFLFGLSYLSNDQGGSVNFYRISCDDDEDEDQKEKDIAASSSTVNKKKKNKVFVSKLCKLIQNSNLFEFSPKQVPCFLQEQFPVSDHTFSSSSSSSPHFVVESDEFVVSVCNHTNQCVLARFSVVSTSSSSSSASSSNVKSSYVGIYQELTRYAPPTLVGENNRICSLSFTTEVDHLAVATTKSMIRQIDIGSILTMTEKHQQKISDLKLHFSENDKNFKNGISEKRSPIQLFSSLMGAKTGGNTKKMFVTYSPDMTSKWLVALISLNPGDSSSYYSAILLLDSFLGQILFKFEDPSFKSLGSCCCSFYNPISSTKTTNSNSDHHHDNNHFLLLVSNAAFWRKNTKTSVFEILQERNNNNNNNNNNTENSMEKMKIAPLSLCLLSKKNDNNSNANNKNVPFVYSLNDDNNSEQKNSNNNNFRYLMNPLNGFSMITQTARDNNNNHNVQKEDFFISATIRTFLNGDFDDESSSDDDDDDDDDDNYEKGAERVTKIVVFRGLSREYRYSKRRIVLLCQEKARLKMRLMLRLWRVRMLVGLFLC